MQKQVNITLHNLPVLLLIAFSTISFATLQFNREHSRVKPTIKENLGFILPAEIQILLFAGDRYLASNVQFITAAGTLTSGGGNDLMDRAKAYSVIADLNPCYEDNFYFANAFLSWGGMPKAGNHILEQSTTCRTWDDIPPFFLGFNRYYFFRDLNGAQKSLKLAMERSRNNKAALQRLYISIESEKFDDNGLALAFLEQEQEAATDVTLKNALQMRIERLKGLIVLEKAQAEFERKFKRPLSNPQELIDNGILTSYPADPLRIGYEFRDNAFMFRQIRINQ